MGWCVWQTVARTCSTATHPRQKDALHILECALDQEQVIRGILSAWFRLQAAVVYRQSAGEWEHLNKIGARSSAVRRGRTLRSVRGSDRGAAAEAAEGEADELSIGAPLDSRVTHN